MKLRDIGKGNETKKPSIDPETWQDKTDKALAYLMDSVGDEVQMKIHACETAAEVQKIQKDQYKRQRRTHIMALFQAITGLKFDDRQTTLADHIKLFEE